MTRLCLVIVALVFIVVAIPSIALAQEAKSSGMAGRVVTRAKLADCKNQAKEQKLSYGKRRKFVRACVNN